MLATTICGKGEEEVVVELVAELVVAELALEVALAEVVELPVEETPEPPSVTVVVWVCVLVTVFVAVVVAGGTTSAVDGSNRLFATEAMPNVTKTTPRVIAAFRKLRLGTPLLGLPALESPSGFGLSFSEVN